MRRAFGTPLGGSDTAVLTDHKPITALISPPAPKGAPSRVREARGSKPQQARACWVITRRRRDVAVATLGTANIGDGGRWGPQLCSVSEETLEPSDLNTDVLHVGV